MENRESAVIILLKSIIYPFGSLATLLIGWLVGLCCFILIGVPMLLGYVVKCGRNILEGNDRLPGWGPYNELFTPGIWAFIILFIFNVVIFVISFIIGTVIGLFVDSSAYSLDLYLVTLTLKGIIIMIITLPLTILEEIALLVYIDTGNVSRALKPDNGIKVFMLGPLEFIKAWIIDNIAVFVVYLPVTLAILFLGLNLNMDSLRFDSLCMGLLILLVIQALMAFITNCIRVFVWAKFYRRVTGGHLDKPAPGPAVA